MSNIIFYSNIMVYKSRIETLLGLTLRCDFEESVFQDIFESLILVDYYEDYDRVDGFLTDAPNSTDMINKHLYLPYFIYYLAHRCARIFFIYCGDDLISDKLIATTIYEGSLGNIGLTPGYFTEELLNYNKLHQNYIFAKELQSLPPDHWKHNFYDKFTCEKDLEFVNYYTDLLNIHPNHLDDMEHLCILLANIHVNIKHTTHSMKKSKFYCYSSLTTKSITYSYFVNLESTNILCKEYSYNENYSQEKIVRYERSDLDYPNSF